MPSEKFEAAVNALQQLNDTNVSNQDKLKMYAFYKQAHEGDCNKKRPGMFDVKGRAKWDAWNALKGTSQETAEAEYIALAKALGATF